MSFENMLSEVSETQHLHIVWFHSYVMSRIGTGTANGLLVTLAEGWKNRQCIQFSSVAQLCPTLCNPRPPCESQHTRPPCPSNLPEFTRTHVHRVSDAIQPSHLRSSPSPAPNPSQHHSLFQWVNSSHEVAKELEFQLQHHSLQRNPRADLLQNGLVGSPCSPRDSQESSPTPLFKHINSSALSFLHSSTLTSIHDHWKNHSLV